MTVAENYADQHDPRDLAFVEARIAEVSPDYLDDFRAVLAGRELLLANIAAAPADRWTGGRPGRRTANWGGKPGETITLYRCFPDPADAWRRDFRTGIGTLFTR